MNKTLAVVIGLAAIALVSAVVLTGVVISTYNTQSVLKNTYEMKVKANEASFDNMWKTIQQSFGVAEAKKDGFRQIFGEYASNRTSEGQGRVVSWVRENAPNPDLQTYDKVLNILTGSRDGWTMRQTELVDIARQYNQNLTVFPKNFILGLFGFQKIDPKIITSSRTEKAFETGKDDNVSLDGKNTTK